MNLFCCATSEIGKRKGLPLVSKVDSVLWYSFVRFPLYMCVRIRYLLIRDMLLVLVKGGR